jgi:integrase
VRGSLRQRPNGYWYIQLRVREAAGVWRTVTIATGERSEAGSRRPPPKAEDAYRQALARYELGGHRPQPQRASRVTVAAWMDAWLDERRARNLAPSTIRQYEDIVRLYIVGPEEAPILGPLPLAQITEARLRQWLRDLLESPRTGRNGSRRLSPTTVRLAYTIFRSALELAVPEHLLRNPFARVPRPKADDFRPAWLEPPQVAALLAAAKDQRLEALWILALATGMRVGEILALRWDDVDLERAEVRVRRSKTPAGRRVIAIGMPGEGGPIVDALRAHRRRQLEERLRAGPRWIESGHVFTTRYGRPLDRNTLRQRDWARLLAAAGLPALRIHDLRHTAGTLALAQGLPIKAVQELLGHRSEAFMLRRYAHALSGDRERVGRMMSELVANLSPADDRAQAELVASTRRIGHEKGPGKRRGRDRKPLPL